MNHSIILITRPLTDGEVLALRGKLGQLWPSEQFTIMHGRVEVAERAVVPGPQEYKVQDHTPIPRFEE